MPAVPFRDLTGNHAAEGSEAIRSRVVEARARACRRDSGPGISCNAEIPASRLRKLARPTEEAVAIFELASRKLGLSARAIHRALKVALTIADLSGNVEVGAVQAAEAVGYRALDRALPEGQYS